MLYVVNCIRQSYFFMQEKLKIIETEDGSHSLYVPELNESYHSFHGAWGESNYVFIEKGLRYWRTKMGMPPQISIFEVGFGTGLNALLTAKFAQQHAMKIAYHSIEAFPIEEAIWRKLNYGKKSGDQALFEQLHLSKWGENELIHPHFELQKTHQKLEEMTVEKPSADVIYFDAFAPSKQAELWELPIFEKMHLLLNEGGVLVTYCAQGQFKRNLKAAGFKVETLPGPPGKKEMVRAEKT